MDSDENNFINVLLLHTINNNIFYVFFKEGEQEGEVGWAAHMGVIRAACGMHAVLMVGVEGEREGGKCPPTRRLPALLRPRLLAHPLVPTPASPHPHFPLSSCPCSPSSSRPLPRIAVPSMAGWGHGGG